MEGEVQLDGQLGHDSLEQEGIGPPRLARPGVGARGAARLRAVPGDPGERPGVHEGAVEGHVEGDGFGLGLDQGQLPRVDLGAFFDVAARLLKPGGALLVYEEHPIMNMFEPGAADPLKPVNSYFKAEPFEDVGAIVYDGTQDLPGETQYWFVHKLSDIMTACLERGLAIEHVREYPHNINADEFEIYDGQAAQLPLSYCLVARKEV